MNEILVEGRKQIELPAGSTLLLKAINGGSYAIVSPVANEGASVFTGASTSATGSVKVGPFSTTIRVSVEVRGRVGAEVVSPSLASLVSGAGKKALRVCLVGDSITAGNTTPLTLFHNYGYWTYTIQILRKAYPYQNAWNFGVAGYTTQNVIDLTLTPAVASPTDVAVVLIGTNDVAGGVALATIKANLLTIWSRLLAAGKPVVAGTIWPRKDAFLNTTAKRRTLTELNAWIRKTVPTMAGVYLWDAYQALADMTTSNPDCVSALFQDDLHPNRGGASLAGQVLAATFNRAFGSGYGPEMTAPSLSDTYDATSAPSGNMLANSTLAGAGTATSWTIARSTGTVAASTPSLVSVPLSSGQSYNKQRISVAGGTTGAAVEEIQFKQTVTPAGGFSIGDIITAGCNFDIVSNTNKLLYVGVLIQPQYGAFPTWSDNVRQIGNTAVGGNIPIVYGGAAQIPDAVLTEAGASVLVTYSIGIDCSAATGAAGTTVVDFDSPFFRRITR